MLGELKVDNEKLRLMLNDLMSKMEAGQLPMATAGRPEDE